MGDMKCNEDTINPSYIEKKNKKRRPKHDPTNGKKRTEGLFCIVFYYFSSAMLEIPKKEYLSGKKETSVS